MWVRNNCYEPPSPETLKKANSIKMNRDARNVLFYAFYQAQFRDIKLGNHCAIVLHKSWNNVVAMSINNETRHAEVGAIKAIPKHIKRSECFMVVVRATIKGRMKNSMPCRSCMQHLENSGIKTCIYSNGHFQFTRWNI